MLTTKEAAAILGMLPQSVSKAIQRGDLAAKKLGRDYVLTSEEVRRFSVERRRAGRPKKTLQKVVS